jgi:hypothetical protein
VIYDLIVVGNGIAAQTFLFEFYSKLDVLKRQNISVAQIYCEEIAASCSLRSIATVSLSGIEEGISDLGNELRDSYFLFEDFQNNHRPKGVEKVKQIVTYTTEKEKSKALRRYKKLFPINNPILKEQMEGIELDAFVISPEILHQWFEEKLSKRDIVHKKKFLKNISENPEGILQCELLGGEILKAEKIVLCTGAFSKLFSSFYNETDFLSTTYTVAGSYLERTFDFERHSFTVTIDGYKIIYRDDEKKIIMGSSSSSDGIVLGDLKEIQDILLLFNKKCSLYFGELTDFKLITGLRHKAAKRRPIASALNANKNIFMIGGLYKNGFTFSHLCAKKILNEINL